MAKKFIIGIDLGGTNLKCALLDGGLKVKARSYFETKSFDSKVKLISGISDSILRFIKEHELAASSIEGIGIGVPGPVDTYKGIVHFFPNIPGWNEVRLKDILEAKLKLSVFIDNDAKLMALAEYKAGAAQGFKNALCLTLGTGVGAGLIINGLLYRGQDNAAGELGHVPINEKGPICGCGSRACLESYIGNKAILKDARKIFGADITLEKASKMAAEKNIRAIKLWGQVGTRLGIALSGVINLLNLDAVIIGGGVAAAGEVLFDNVKDTILLRSMKVQSKRVKVLKASLGVNAGLIGAGYLVRERKEELR